MHHLSQFAAAPLLNTIKFLCAIWSRNFSWC